MASKEKNVAAIEKARTFSNVPWCEEYEKMISGMRYTSWVPELEAATLRARRITMEYNTYLPDDATPDSLRRDREAILKDILGSLGPRSYIEPPFNVDYGCNISIGEDFYANFNLCILDCGLVTIGDRVLIGPGVGIFSASHETEPASRRAGIEYTGQVTIGNDCWIGGKVVIMPGVTIGNGSTIGAGSVVTRDIPPFSVAVGSPARVIKKVEPIPDIIQDERALTNLS